MYRCNNRDFLKIWPYWLFPNIKYQSDIVQIHIQAWFRQFVDTLLRSWLSPYLCVCSPTRASFWFYSRSSPTQLLIKYVYMDHCICSLRAFRVWHKDHLPYLLASKIVSKILGPELFLLTFKGTGELLHQHGPSMYA